MRCLTRGRLVRAEKLYNILSSPAGNVRAFTDDMRISEGMLNKLIEEKSIHDNCNSVSEKLDVLLERVNSGEGLKGSLVRDEELSNELKTALKERTTLIKDGRELFQVQHILEPEHQKY